MEGIGLGETGVAFLYPTYEDAEDSQSFGGTGFFVEVPYSADVAAQLEGNHVYLVTNRHVAQGVGAARLWDPTGQDRIFSIEPGRWIYSEDGDDLAVALMRPSKGPPSQEADYQRAPWTRGEHIETFVDDALLQASMVFPGDECALIGRLHALDGRSIIQPLPRFGVLMTTGEVDIDNRPFGLQRSLLIEARSVAKFSGSPVFLLRRSGFHRFVKSTSGEVGTERVMNPFLNYARQVHVVLLGVCWGHIADYTDVQRETDGGWDKEESLRAAYNSGIATVIPAWRLRELLMSEAAVRTREEVEDRVRLPRQEARERVMTAIRNFGARLSNPPHDP